MRLQAVITLLFASALGSVSAGENLSWRFVSMPDFLNVDTEYPQEGWEDSLSYILESVKSEKPDFLLVPGDLVMGHWHGGKEHSGIAGIEHFAARYYPAWKERLEAQDLKFYTALGDHEIGDNPWKYPGALESRAAIALWRKWIFAPP